MSRLRRQIAAFAALLGLYGGLEPAAARAGAPWQANDDDSLLLDVHLGGLRLGGGVRGYVTPEGACLNLRDIVGALDLPLTVDEAKGIAQGWAFEERNQLSIDRSARRVRFGGRQDVIDPVAIRDTPQGWCADTRRMSTWLGIDLKVDLNNAIVLVSSKIKLPVQLAAERRARAARVRPTSTTDMSKLPQIRLPYRMWRMPSLDAVVTVGAARDKQRGNRVERQYEVYASGEVARMSVDARVASNIKGVPESVRIRGYRSDAAGTLLGPLHATHFEIGDVASFNSPLVTNALSGRGVALTNRPLDRPDTFDRKTFRGELPSGWDAEIYRNEQLLAVAQPRNDGRYEFVDVPLLFGQNRIEIVLYGPQGQVRRSRETLLVGADSIPPGKTWYWASVLDAQSPMIPWGRKSLEQPRGWQLTMGGERGVDRRTSVALQLHSLVFDDQRVTYVEGAVRRSIGPALVEVSAAAQTGGGQALRAQLLADFGGTYVTAESVVARDFRSDRVEGNVVGEHKIAIERSFDLGRLSVPVHLEGRYLRLADGSSSLESGARVSLGLGRFSITSTLDWIRRHNGSGLDPPDRIEGSLLANGSLGRTRLRGELRWRLRPSAEFESAAIVAERSLSERSSLRAEFGYDRGYDRFRTGFGYVRHFRRFSLIGTGELASDGSVAAGLNIAFSLGRNPVGGMRVTSQKLASSGTVLARVFRDENGDGVRGPGEAYEKDARLLVQRVPTEQGTNAKGELVIDGLAPHLPLVVAIDGSSLPDPMVQPATAGVAVTPRPGLSTIIDLPVVGAGEIMGTLVDGNGRELEGVDIELLNSAGGVLATARSDFDGYFVFESIPYGKYRLQLNKLSASAVGVSQMLHASVILDKANSSARLGRVETGGVRDRRLAYQDLLMIGPGAELVLAR